MSADRKRVAIAGGAGPESYGDRILAEEKHLTLSAQQTIGTLFLLFVQVSVAFLDHKQIRI